MFIGVAGHLYRAGRRVWGKGKVWFASVVSGRDRDGLEEVGVRGGEVGLGVGVRGYTAAVWGRRVRWIHCSTCL